jgi:hypothetical protein
MGKAESAHLSSKLSNKNGVTPNRSEARGNSREASGFDRATADQVGQLRRHVKNVNGGEELARCGDIGERLDQEHPQTPRDKASCGTKRETTP